MAVTSEREVGGRGGEKEVKIVLVWRYEREEREKGREGKGRERERKRGKPIQILINIINRCFHSIEPFPLSI